MTENTQSELCLIDAWMEKHPAKPHPPSCGIYDSDQWEQGPHCRDFMFISPDLRKQIVDIWVDTETDASDHQPVKLELGI